jgi:DNA-binding SARP family transcriptional activator
LSHPSGLTSYRSGVRFLVLGSTRAAIDETVLDLGARKPRSIVAALAMTPGRAVSADLLADLVWAGEPPRAAHGALHSYLSGLRRVLEPDRPSRGAASLIETTDHGYVLRVPRDSVDAHAFADAAASVERALAPLGSQLTGAGPGADWPTRAEVSEVLGTMDTALAQWQGEPYADLPEHPDVLAARTSLEQLRMSVEEVRLLGLLALGEHASVLAATETAVGPHQLRERLWAVHVVALVRAGRQAEALEALRTVRGVLAEDLGIDPGAELRGLEDAVLQQVPGLETTLPRDEPALARRREPVRRVAPTEALTVGREAEQSALTESLGQALSGRAAFAQLVGEPGIGKTHLVDTFVAVAQENGVGVGVGRCARDAGAPPLWPLRSAFAALGLDDALDLHEEPGESPEQRAFSTSERIASAVVRAASAGPVALVVEDLHWGDDATLRALVHLVDTCPPDRNLCLLVTRRSHPEPTGTLAALGEALARRHSVRLDLTGLDADRALDLVRAGGGDVPDAVAASWQSRSAGNPFFLIELARLGVQDDGAVPATVLDVVGRRLADLPTTILERLQTAAVVGPRFGLATVAATDGAHPDEVADELDLAADAGLVVEVAPEEYAFAHALTQEAVLAPVAGGRIARRHARVAHALEAEPRLSDPVTRVADLARHWLAAGPSHVGSAWPAARAAAAEASALASYPEAMRLRSAAVDAHRRVVGGDDEVHYDLLLELATDAALAAQWPVVEEAAFEAMSLGRTLGSPVLVGGAAAALTRYCVWLPQGIDVVFEDAVDDLRWALAHVEDDAATRCRLQLSLAVELYYDVGTAAERRALLDSGMALARSIGDPELTWQTCGAACMVAWNPVDLDDRLAWAAEGVTAARQAGDARAEAVLLVQLGIARAEAGDRPGWEEASTAAAAIARRERLPYVLMTLHWLWLSLAALRDQPDEVRDEYDNVVSSIAQVAVPAQELMAPYAWVAARLWDPDLVGQVVDMFAGEHEAHGEAGVVVHQLLARAGRVEDLRRALATFPIPVEEELYWSTVSDWAREAEAAAVAGDVPLARQAVAVLSPYRGRLVLAGAASIDGPVDGALALASAAAGDLAAANELADSAAAQATEWELDAYLRWLAGHRTRMGF